MGCETTAIDINPVAWFILKCTLEYPQRLAGQKRPLPEFIVRNREFMEDFFKAQGIKGAALRKQLEKLGFGATDGKPAGDKGQQSLGGLHFEDHSLEADLAWHVRAWGQWVLDRARRDLARFYPTYADFEPLKKSEQPYEPRPMQLVPLREGGTPDIDKLNVEFTADYLADPRNPRWVAKPTVAYLWARTVKCKNCRATVPLLKTRWLCRTDRKRVLMTMQPNADRTGVVFGIEANVGINGANAAQRREYDKRIGSGTMSRSGVQCPCCSTILTTQDIRLEGQAGRLGVLATTVAVNGLKGKEHRLPTADELHVAGQAGNAIASLLSDLPFGLPEEPIPEGASRVSGGSPFTVYIYGLTKWKDLFLPRQLLALGVLAKCTRAHAGPCWI